MVPPESYPRLDGASAASLPETIGPYRITGYLGRGGMGEVLRAYDNRLGRPVAIKRIHPNVREPEKALQRFKREARAVARLSHPSIVQVFDWVEADEQHWLVMELIEGCSLDRVVAEERLPIERALEIARDIASALAEAHGAGIIHRDLKTSNVILSRRGRAKVLDFGIAKSVSPAAGEENPAGVGASATLTAEGRVLGTVGSMSPEQALGRKVDHRSDLFSFGVLLYEILSGKAPFEGRNTPEILNKICNLQEEPLHVLNPEISGEISSLVANLLEKDPELRPSDAHHVGTEIDRLSAASSADSGLRTQPLEDQQKTTRFDLEAISADKVSDAAPPSRKARRITTIVPLIALGAILGMAALGLMMWNETSRPKVSGSSAQDAGSAGELTKTELYRRGNEFLDRSDQKAGIDAAIGDFQAALALDPRFAPALAGLARAYRLDHYRGSKDPQRLDQALAAARQAVEINEHLAVARVSLGWVLVEMGQLEEAFQEFERALELEPTNSGALSGLGQAHGARGDYLRAEAYFLRAIEAQPEVERLQSFLGQIYYRAGRYDDAAEAFQRHLEKDPDAFVALSNLGATYYMQGRLSDAATQFQNALLVEPDPLLYSNVGTIHFSHGLYAQAATAFEKAIENGLANDPLMWGNLGDAYRWTPGRENESQDAYLRAIQLLNGPDQPEDVTLRTRLALFRAKRGDCQQALAQADSVDESSGTDGNAWFRLAVTREVCGQREAALRSLKAALAARFSMEEIKRDPELLDLRQDVRFHEVARDHHPEAA